MSSVYGGYSIENMTQLKAFAFIICCLCSLITEMHAQANYGDNCTQTDSSNCTSPQLVCSENGTCICSLGYTREDFDLDYSICRKPSYEEKCDPTFGCEETLYCLNMSGSQICQCDKVEYFNPRARLCVSLNDIEVSINSIITTDTSVQIQWEGSGPESGVEYNLQWTPYDGRIDFSYPMGAQVSHLQPGTEYKFTVVSLAPEGQYSLEKQFLGPNVTICTKILNGGKCGICTECLDNTTTCIMDIDGLMRCLCGNMFYNASDPGNCTSKPTYNESCNVIIGCQNTLQCANISGSLICRCFSFSEYYDLQSGKCLAKPSRGERCNVSIGCKDYSKCLGHPPTCQCTGEDVYLDDISSMCLQLSDLQVGLSSVDATDTTVTFRWDGDSPESGVEYSLEWVPNNGHLEYISPDGGEVSYLQSGTQYNFTIVSTLSNDNKFFGPNITICTKVLYGRECSTCGECLDNVTVCDEDNMNLVSRCLCSEVYFNTTPEGNCTSLSELHVTNISSISTDSTIILHWKPNTKWTHMSYKVDVFPIAGKVNSINSSGCVVSGLTSGTNYSIFVNSVLPGDSYNDEKVAVAPGYTVMTKVLYAGECRTSDDCFDNATFCDANTNDAVPRCLCMETFFNATPLGNCTSLDEVIVTNLSNITTDSTIYLYWEANPKWSSILSYDLDMFPGDGHVDRINGSGCVVSGLAPETEYSFFVTSIIPGDGYSDINRFANPPEFTVMTKIYYLGVCNSNNKAQCLETVCRMANDGTLLCMCDVGYYKDMMGICVASETLQVLNASVTVTATTAVLTWSEKQQLPPTLMYTILWTPRDGRLDFLNNTNAHISDLTPGASYNVSVVSVLPPDTYYPELSSSVNVIVVLQKPAFKEACNVTIGCQDSQHCINVSGSMVCLCDSSSEYYDSNSDLCLARPSLGETCNTSIGCQEFFQCLGTPPACNCNGTDVYFDSFDYQCLPIKDLAVTIISTTITASSVTFTWAPNNPETEAEYDLLWTPCDGQLDYTNVEGGEVSGLQPGNQYNFIILSGLIGDNETKYYGPNITVCTLALYGEECNSCSTCQNNATTCIKAKDSKFHCLCRDKFYNQTQTGNCSSLNDLAVTDISSTSTTSTINLSWAVRSHVSSVTYKITWYPSGGQVGSVSSTGGSVTGLSPGVMYYFTIITVLAGDTYNYEKNITSPEYLAKIPITYLEVCTPYTNEECQFMTPCVQDKESNFRCMCDDNSFFNDKIFNCSNLENLKVSHVTATVTATTATITWTTQGHPSSVTYTLNWVPVGGTLDSINSTTAYVSGLKAGTIYNFTVVSLLDSDIFYPEKRAFSKVSSIMTKTQGGSSGNNLGVGVGVGVSCAVLIIILIVGVSVYKRRTPNATRLQNFHEQEYVRWWSSK